MSTSASAALVLLALAMNFCVAPLAMAQSTKPATAPSYQNPVVRQRADPFIVKHTNGFYYFTASVPEYDRIELRRSQTIQGLGSAEPKVIWRKHDKGAMGAHIWAPEIHRIGDAWYIYFAAGNVEDIWKIRIYVLSNSSANPLEGEWVERGQLKTNWESFALDSTTFEHHGQNYLVWAQADPKFKANTCLYIAKMSDPLHIEGNQVCISRPELPWECIGYKVNEGPAVLVRNGRVFLAYSAAATDANYCMGMLTAKDDADLLDPKSWVKSPAPVFRTTPANSQFGPGHCSFTVAEDGVTDLLVYHARPYEKVKPDPLRDPNRHTRVQPLHWRPDGTPDFGQPAPDAPQP